MKEKIKVILADDHKILLSGLNMQISSWEEFEVIATCVNGKDTIEACEKSLPDIILMDMQMPVLSGAEATRILKEKHPEVKIVALTTFDDHETVENALNAGCDGFLLKVSDPEQLRSSLHSVMDGVNVMDAEAMKHFRQKEESPGAGEFNERELTVLKLVCKGYTNKEGDRRGPVPSARHGEEHRVHVAQQNLLRQPGRPYEIRIQTQARG